jgi:predicted MPP superfamily phosphohydrolase
MAQKLLNRLEEIEDEPRPRIGGEAPKRLTRRRLLRRGLAVTGALCAGGLVYGTEAIEVTHHRVPVRALDRPCRVVQITDLHRSWCVPESFIARAVDLANAQHPDLVLLTGDFVTRHSDYIVSCIRPLSRLRAPLGLYAVFGNHDYRSDLWQGAPRIESSLNTIGVSVLTNRSVVLANGLRLVGVDDYDTGNPDLEVAFREVDFNAPTLAMTHNPLMFRTMCVYPCVTLAGHTHGGQINLPLLTELFTDDRARYMRGWFRERKQPGRLYVSRGIGLMTVPFRIASLPEIAVFDLMPA